LLDQSTSYLGKIGPESTSQIFKWTRLGESA